MLFKPLILVACWIGLTLGDPVLFWGGCSKPKPSLHKISQDEFTEELKTCKKNSMLLIILEPHLTFPDFRCSNNDYEASCFSNMKGFTQKSFHPNVVNPKQSAYDACSNREHLTIDSDGNYDHIPEYETGKCIIVTFASPNHNINRSDELKNHDAHIAKVYHKLSEKGDIIAVYTGETPTKGKHNRQRRAASKESGTMFRSANDFLIYYTTLSVKDGKDITPLYISGMTISGKNNTAFTVDLEGPNTKLNFLITQKLGYFSMSNLFLNSEEYRVPSDINSPTDFSYYCGNQTFVGKKPTNTKVIHWNSLQMQAPFNEKVKNDFVFGDPWYCVGFFSPGILAGLFVVFILLGIMSVGICWMMDINTMDRFDDPKGKTITINVTD